jgi:hypothetical protein
VAQCSDIQLLRNLVEVAALSDDPNPRRYEAPIRERDVLVEDTDINATPLPESSDRHSLTATEHPPNHFRSDAHRKAQFDEIRALYDTGCTVGEICRKLGLGPRRVHRWVCRIDFPERNVMAPKPSMDRRKARSTD